MIEHGTANKDACFRATRSDTGVSVYMGVGSGGTNHGVYSYKLGKWIVYADGSNIYCNGTGTVAIGHGGTGATTAAAARTNLGITCTSLYNGSLSSGSINLFLCGTLEEVLFGFWKYRPVITPSNSPNSVLSRKSCVDLVVI